MPEHTLRMDRAETPEGRVFLVVDDDPMVRKIVARGLSQLNPSAVLEEEDGLAAQAVLREQRVDVVITDVVMPNMDGLALMKWAQEHCPEPLWIVLSGLDTFDAAVEALQLGAFDYLAKPPEIPRVRVAVRNALDQIELTRERRRLYAELEDSNAQARGEGRTAADSLRRTRGAGLHDPGGPESRGGYSARTAATAAPADTGLLHGNPVPSREQRRRRLL
jgi:DNA-binding NtrC family response regulator